MPPIAELEEIRRSQILAAAVAAIAETGHAEVTMADICDRANLSKGGVAHYYASKRELFTAAFQSHFERLFEKCRETIGRFDDPADQILSFFWFLDPEDTDVSMGYPLLIDFMSLAAHDEAYRRIYLQWVGIWLDLVIDVLKRGQSSGRFLKCCPETAAGAISAIYQGFALRWYLTPERYPGPQTVDSLKRTLRALLVVSLE